jgi:hypothetical protein
MGTYQPVPGIQFSPGPDKETVELRIARGVKVTNVAVTSSLYALPMIKSSVDNVIADTKALTALVDKFNTAQANLDKARTALGTGVLTWDGSYDILIAAGEKHCATEDDGTNLALPVRGKTRNPFAMPISVEFTHDATKREARIRVNRAPGMNVVVVQYSPDPITATSWIELDGYGAVHVIPNLPPGTYWARAASKTARAKSDFTTPVSVIVR